VYAFVCSRVFDRAAAQDLTAQVFHEALAGLKQFEWRGRPFAAWLFQIAANEMASYFQRRSREKNVPAEFGAEDPPDTGKPADARVAEIEQRAALFRLVSLLPREQRRVIEMRFAEEKSISKIARALRRTEGAVKQLQFRALEHLRARMRDADG
jgi:RNA polymerase sigma-70 factor (ECF subfamily)